MRNPNDLSVLYLEDEVIVAFDTTEHLNDLGFGRVDTFYRLKPAEAAVAERRYDVAILDINLNDGQTSAALGKSLAEAGIPVIYASGNTGEAEALRGQGQHFVAKPYHFDQIGKLLEELLDVSFD